MAFTKDLVLRLARTSGLLAAIRRISSGPARILAYHGVTEHPCDGLNYDGFHVPVADFEAQMEHLARACQVVPLSDVLAPGRPGTRPRVAVTFDDGYANNAGLAQPVLQRMGLPAAFFITTGFIDGTHRPWWFDLRRHLLAHPEIQPPPGAAAAHPRTPWARLAAWEVVLRRTTEAHRVHHLRRMGVESGPANAHDRFMSWDDIRSLVRAGHTLGAHTVSHPSLSREDQDRRRHELGSAKSILEERIGGPVTALAYPYGSAAHVAEMVQRDAAAVGYILAVTTMPGLVGSGTEPFLLPRLNVSGRHTGPRFEALVAGLGLLRR